VFVGAVVSQKIQLMRIQRAGWTFPRYGWAAHPTLGHIEGLFDSNGEPERAIAYAPNGRPVAIVDTATQAMVELATL